MCRMIGIASKDFIRSEWLLLFESLAVCGKIRNDMKEPGHHDGWGMVSYFKKNFPEYLERQPHSVTQDSELFENGAKLIEQSKCKIAIAHFRKISVGKPMISNTHPFLYKEWAFCHNGTIFEHEKIPLQKLRPSGTTDSERFFLYLVEQIQNVSQKDRTTSLKQAIEKVKKNLTYTSLTFLLTDGESIYAYRECDPQYADYYTLFSTKVNHGTICSSEPLKLLGNEKWKSLENGVLVVLQF